MSVIVRVDDSDADSRMFSSPYTAALWLLERCSSDELMKLSIDGLRAAKRRAVGRETAAKSDTGNPVA